MLPARQPMNPLSLDLRGLKCPLPALRVGQALRRAAPGSVLAAACTDPLATLDIPHLVRGTGDVLEEVRHEGDTVTFLIRKAG